ncbi:MAG: hypothetical protein JWN95_2419 [Frankiales bacterium]|nr:hypothetical protein [Frankiales bacterium]
MCTVVCRWSPARSTLPTEPSDSSDPGDSVPIQILALRDELASRTFDEPDNWWPDQPGVIGGRDQLGGGTWCASDVESGVTAVVLNRAERRVALAGAVSRGALPLLAVRDLRRWPAAIDVTPMASFNLVLFTPDALTWWRWDGANLVSCELEPGQYLFTPRGLLSGDDLPPWFPPPAARLDASLSGTPAEVWADWLPVVENREPSADPTAMIVRLPVGEDVFETVFGQFIATRPGRLRLDYARKPYLGGRWASRQWPADRESSTIAKEIHADR